jgi:hypothetical protein
MMVALIGLNPLARLKEVPQNFNVRVLTGRVGSLDPHQVPSQNINAQLIALSRHHRTFVGWEGILLLCDSPLQDAEVRPMDDHCAVVAHVVGAQRALKCNLWLRGQRQWGVRTDVEKKVIL